MQERQALDAFAALSQETRLRIIRLLVKAGPKGLAACTVSEAVEASSSNTSFHLGHLERAGLIRSRREARSIIYSLNVAGLTGLIRFLMEDCCQANPEICAPTLESLVAACSCEPETADG
jgi:DNA-binding transcriptional ArsR family regulator